MLKQVNKISYKILRYMGTFWWLEMNVSIKSLGC